MHPGKKQNAGDISPSLPTVFLLSSLSLKNDFSTSTFPWRKTKQSGLRIMGLAHQKGLSPNSEVLALIGQLGDCVSQDRLGDVGVTNSPQTSMI